jgi:hypothetical protein
MIGRHVTRLLVVSAYRVWEAVREGSKAGSKVDNRF